MGSLPNLHALSSADSELSLHQQAAPSLPPRFSSYTRRHQQGSPATSTPRSSVRGVLSGNCNHCGGHRDDSLAGSSSSVRRLIALVRATPSQFGPAFSERALARNHAALCLGHATFAAALVPLLALHSSALRSEMTAAVLLGGCFLTAALSSLATPLILMAVRRRANLALPVCYLLAAISISAHLYPSAITLPPAFFLLGLAIGPLCHLQTSFLLALSAKLSFVSEEPQPLVQVRLSRHFHAAHCLGHAVGTAVAGFVLWHQPDEPHLDFPRDADGKRICGACPPWLPAPLVYDITLPCRAAAMVYSICLGCAVMAMALSATFLEPLVQPQHQQVAREPLSVMLRCNRHVRILCLAPLLLFIGLQQAFLFIDYSKWFVACGLGATHVCLTLVGMGVLQAVAGSTLSLLMQQQHAPRALVAAVGLVFHACLILALAAWRPSRDDAALFYVICAAWGVCNAIWETLAFALVTALYSESWRAPLAQLLFWRHIGALLGCVMHPLLCVRTKLLTLAALLVVAVGGLMALERTLKSRRRQYKCPGSVSCKLS